MQNLSRLTTSDLDQKFTEADSNKVLDLSGFSFTEELFDHLDDYLSSSPSLKKMIFTKVNLSNDQKSRLLVITNSNLMKGVKLLDEDHSPFGDAFTDWHVYNQAKIEACDARETTLEALKYFSEPPQHVIDFGAGTGEDTIPLIQRGCRSLTAIDGDREATEILSSRVSEINKDSSTTFKIYEGPFITYQPDQLADLFISSFTWPYRPPNDFPECWIKTISCVKLGGIIAGHFFGAPENRSEAMTYHTTEQLKTLLKHNFEILFFNVEKPGERKIYGGETPPWGNLYHVVAKKIKEVHD